MTNAFQTQDRAAMIRMAALCAISFVSMVGYAMARTPIESIFIEDWGRDAMPLAWLGIAVGAVALVSLWDRISTRLSLPRMLFLLSAASGFGFALLLLAMEAGLPQASFLAYIFKDLYIVLLVETFYAFANSIYPLETARWAYGLFGIMASLGGRVGNKAIEPLATSMGTERVPWLLLPCLVLVCFFVGWIAHGLDRKEVGIEKTGGWKSILQAIAPQTSNQLTIQSDYKKEILLQALVLAAILFIPWFAISDLTLINIPIKEGFSLYLLKYVALGGACVSLYFLAIKNTPNRLVSFFVFLAIFVLIFWLPIRTLFESPRPPGSFDMSLKMTFKVHGIGAWTALIAALVGCMIRVKGTGQEKPGLMLALKTVQKSRYLLWMVCLIASVQLATNLIEYVYQGYLETHFVLTAERAGISGDVYAAIDDFTLAFNLAAGLVLRHLGVSVTLLIIPLLVGCSAGLTLVFPGFLALAACKVANKSFDYSLFRVAKEALYLPLSYQEKTKGKAVVDVLTYRVAKGGASLLTFALIALGVQHLAMGLALGLMGLWVACTLVALKRYKALLVEREGGI